MTQRAESGPSNRETTMSANAAAPAKSRRPEKRRVRLSEVARAAGVSAMTVSRVVNGTGSVGPEMREYVRGVIRQLGYTPHSAARSLAIARRERIAVLHGDSRTASLSKLLIGVLEESNRKSAQLLVRRVEPRDPNAWRTVSRLVDDRIVGVILSPPLGDIVCLVDALRAAGIAVVAVSAGATREDAMYVGIDERRAAYEMTQHLFALGHRRIGFIRGPAGWSAGDERWHGFLAALRDGGIDAGCIPVAQVECTFRSGIEAAEALLDDQPVPTAIFASSDNMAAAVVTVAHRRGLQVPDALTVVGFDDDLAASATWPELTTIRQPVAEMAVEAVNLLIAAIRSGSPEPQTNCRKKVVGHDLILRASASAPAMPTSGLPKA
jgi:LacI family transcriptional regulator